MRKRKQETKREREKEKEGDAAENHEGVRLQKTQQKTNHTSREQEVAEEQQNRAQSEYDTGRD